MLSTTIVLCRLFAARPTGPSCGFLPRTIHDSHVARQHNPPNPVLHGIENYFVDGDNTPLPNAFIYKVDATSDVVESAYEPASGPWSRVGTGMKEDQTVGMDELYDVSSGEDVKLRYGVKKRYMEDNGLEMSQVQKRHPLGPKT